MPISHGFRIFSPDSLSADHYWSGQNNIAGPSLSPSVHINRGQTCVCPPDHQAEGSQPQRRRRAMREKGRTCMNAPTQPPPSRVCIISTWLFCDDHTLIIHKHTHTHTRVTVFHHHSAEAEFPTGLARAQFNGVGSHIRLDIQQQTRRK